jgi:hypothetical protein
MTQKIVINSDYGGFGLSELAQARYRELAGIPLAEFRWELDRSDPHLVQTVLELGEQANAPYADLKVVEIPEDVEWTIKEYDGCEWVAEVHRTWS